jgi:hypothetical protein
MTTRQPPAFVPTLTDVVVQGASAPPATQLSHEQLVERVMQRVDLTLDRRLREAIAAVVLEHSRDLAPALRERIEGVVSSVVSEALAAELPSVPRHPGR